MPFIPHTQSDIQEMLAVIGIDHIDDLYDEVPAELRATLQTTPEALSEMAVMRLMRERAAQNGSLLNFAGAGAYEHHIPAAVWELAGRGEFLTAYTPYQAEASQGTLQVIYEFQTLLTRLTAMDVCNASVYDGASGLAEAVLMAVRLRKDKARKVLIPRSLSPLYRRAVTAIVGLQDIELVELPMDAATAAPDLSAVDTTDCAALVIPFPDFFGQLMDVHTLTDWAAEKGLISIACVNPMALALLTPPGQWGKTGADICVGEAQPFGVPLSAGGPYVGFVACKKAHVRQMPGRIIGRTVDLEGKPGFTLTLQAREQHIRRAKATSNICTNQGLAMTAATIYLSLMGPEGLQKVALACHQGLNALTDQLGELGLKPIFDGSRFHEMVIRLPVPVAPVLESMMDNQHVLAGIDLSVDYPELGNALLICVTETRTAEDRELFIGGLRQALAGAASSVTTPSITSSTTTGLGV